MSNKQAIEFSERFQAAITEFDLLRICEGYCLPHSPNISYYDLRAEISLLAEACLIAAHMNQWFT